MVLPESIAKSLKDHGFRVLKDGILHRGKERWLAVTAAAPQSWGRLLSPLLAQAILEAQAKVRNTRAKPLAVLFAPYLSEAMHDRLAAFVQEVAPTQPWIAGDAHGRVFFHFPGEPTLKAAPLQPLSSMSARPRRQLNLFSDLNQWMLKVLLAPLFHPRLLRAPRDRTIRNARALAETAKVSVPTAARFVSALDEMGQLDRSHGELRIADPAQLLESWRSAISVSFKSEVGARFVRGKIEGSASQILRKTLDDKKSPGSWTICAGLFEACDVLALGHVAGAPHHFYISSLDWRQLERMGLVPAQEGEQSKVLLRIPKFPEALFRAAPVEHGIQASDIIQCWLDVSHHRARGQEQADVLWRRTIRPALEAR